MNKTNCFSRCVPVFAWMGGIFFVSSVRNPYCIVPDSVWLPDEIIGRYCHVFEFAALAMLLARGFTLERVEDLNLCKVVFSYFISLFFSYFDYLHQTYVPGRSFQILDLAQNLLGIIIGLLLGQLFYSTKTNKLI